MKKYYITHCLCIAFIIIHISAFSQHQLENTMSQYFRNRMLQSPGFTGADGNKIYALQNRSWLGFDGAPIITSICTELNFGQNSGIGLQIMNDVAGVLNSTFGVFNYAYKIKLNQEQNLRIGISLAFSGDRVNSKFLDQGGVVDPLIVANIDNKIQYDGNIATVYTNKKLTFNVSLFRLRENFLIKSLGNANLAFAQFSGSYDINIGSDEKLSLKPLAIIRLYRNTIPLFDFGAQFEYNKQLNLMAIYQSSGNLRAGAGLHLTGLGEANLFYNTNVKIGNASSQQYEIGLGIYLKEKK